MHLFDKCYSFTRAREVMASGYYPYFVPIEGSSDTEAFVAGERKIMVGSNNYLGLTHHPCIVEAAQEAIKQYGSGCTGSRFLNGNTILHDRLEERLAKFMGTEAALVFSTGFQTNLGVIGTLVATEKAEGLEGVKLLVVQPLDKHLQPEGEPQIAAENQVECPQWQGYNSTSRQPGRLSSSARPARRFPRATRPDCRDRPHRSRRGNNESGCRAAGRPAAGSGGADRTRSYPLRNRLSVR